MTSLINVSVRGAGLALRFALTFSIAIYMTLEDMGVVGYILAITSAVPAAFSFGLHYRLNREAVGMPLPDVIAHLRDRLILHLFVSLAAGGSALIALEVIGTGQPSYSIILMVVLISSFELMGNEIYLMLLSLKKSVTANIFLFLRTSIWIPLFICVLYTSEEHRSVIILTLFWAGGIAIGYIFVLYSVRSWPWKDAFARSLDLKWMFVGASASLMIYLSDISTVGAQYLDRAIIGAKLGVDEIGIYVFFWNIANGVQQLVKSSVVQASLPDLVGAARTEQPGVFRAAIVKNCMVAAVWVLGVGAVGIIFVHFALMELGKPELIRHEEIMYVMIIGTLLRIVADVLSYGLYAASKDYSLAAMNMLSVVLSALLGLVGAEVAGLFGVAVGMAVAGGGILVSRLWCLRGSLT